MVMVVGGGESMEPEGVDDRRERGDDDGGSGGGCGGVPAEGAAHSVAEPGATASAAPNVARTAAAGPRAAAKFVGRVSQLDVAQIRDAVQAWHAAMRVQSEPWFAAESAAAHAVSRSGRTSDQELLLGHLAESFRRLWYRGARGARGAPPATPEPKVDATEASGQYVATVAMLAVLVRDRIAAAEFAQLYQPFAALIPADELARE